MPLTLGIVEEVFAAYEVVPFGLERDDFLQYAMSQFQNRFNRIEKAREQTLAEVLSGASIDDAFA
jgi:ribonucleoside-diphosphate reductase beta chain